MEPWSSAMERALYGPGGFYRRERPADHFRTSAHAAPDLLATVLVALGQSVANQLGSPALTVVDAAAGDGELAAAVAQVAPSEWTIVAVDLRDRPASLPDRVRWENECGMGVHGLLVANEWLDNVPVDVLTRTEGQWRQVLVDSDGRRELGPVATAAQLDWLSRWWPSPIEGDVAEVGIRRDAAWSELTGRLAVGLAVAVDYAVDPARHRHGTLTGYRDGHQVDPVPDGSCDLTAHVAVPSVAAAGEAAGLGGTQLLSQRDVLVALGLTARRPPLEQAGTDPVGYLTALSAASRAAELMDPDGLGGFAWLLQGRGVDPARALAGQRSQR